MRKYPSGCMGYVLRISLVSVCRAFCSQTGSASIFIIIKGSYCTRGVGKVDILISTKETQSYPKVTPDRVSGERHTSLQKLIVSTIPQKDCSLSAVLHHQT